MVTVMFLKRIAVVAALSSILSVPSFSQDQRNFDSTIRSVKGLVTDRGNKPVPGAVVLIKDTKTLQVRSFVTQDDGTYRFYGLSSNDEYELRAQRNGNSSGSKTLSAFDNRKEAVIDLKLK
jgi:hypothetical protein